MEAAVPGPENHVLSLRGGLSGSVERTRSKMKLRATRGKQSVLPVSLEADEDSCMCPQEG